MFWGKNIVNFGDQRKDWISLETYIQTINSYTFLKSKINILNVDWKINFAMATVLNQPLLEILQKVKNYIKISIFYALITYIAF